MVLQVVCGVADGNEPINGVLSITSSLEMTLHQWGIYDKSQIQDIYNTIRRNSEDLMLEFMKRESTLSPEEKGCATAETDLLGKSIRFSYSCLWVLLVKIFECGTDL